MNWLKQKLASKKVKATIVGIVIVIANDALGLKFQPETVASVVGLIISYVIGQGIADKGKEAAKINAEAAPKIEAIPGGYVTFTGGGGDDGPANPNGTTIFLPTNPGGTTIGFHSHDDISRSIVNHIWEHGCAPLTIGDPYGSGFLPNT